MNISQSENSQIITEKISDQVVEPKNTQSQLTPEPGKELVITQNRSKFSLSLLVFGLLAVLFLIIGLRLIFYP